MAAKPHRDYDRQGQASMASPLLSRFAGAQQDDAGCRKVVSVVSCLFAAAIVVSAFVLLLVFLDHMFPNKSPVYSVAIAGVAGLDPARDVSAGDRATLSPVFNLTVHIRNARNAYDTACVPSLSTAVVSYGDAFLDRGSVPEFCADQMQESERVTRVWGQDVVVPRFLRDQLAGELAVGEAAADVQVTMPVGCNAFLCFNDILVCMSKIGGGPSRCVMR